MEEHFLKDFVSGPQKFSPAAWYNPHGDCIIYQTSDEGVVAERVDDLLTIYHSALDGRAIGYQIKGVRAIMQVYGLDGIQVECTRSGEELIEVSLSAILLAAYERGPKTIGRRKAYAGAFDSFTRQPQLRIEGLDRELATN